MFIFHVSPDSLQVLYTTLDKWGSLRTTGINDYSANSPEGSVPIRAWKMIIDDPKIWGNRTGTEAEIRLCFEFLSTEMQIDLQEVY